MITNDKVAQKGGAEVEKTDIVFWDDIADVVPGT